MKQYIYAGMILLAASACTRETFSPEATDSHEIFATIADGDNATKAILLDNPGVRMESFWTGGDQIGIAGQDGTPVSFSVAASDISGNGKTAVFRSESTVPSGALTAFSPFQADAAIGGGNVHMTLPATQHYTVGYGVSQPDPEANLMVGTGSASGGLAFRNTLAILKIGKRFEAETTIKQVIFKDLSGAAVAGSVSITPGNAPVASVNGTELSITLDCGEEGVKLPAGEPGRFYIMVPARKYAKGVEITFVTASGERTTHTTGSSKGTTFERGVVYPVGDVPTREYIASNVAVLDENAVVMTADLLRQVTILSCVKGPVFCDDGSVAKLDNTTIELPYMDIYVPIDMGFHEGQFLIFDATDDFPSGGVLVIKEIIAPFGDNTHALLKAEPTGNPFAAYKSLEFGDGMYTEDGSFTEDGGLDVDLSGYLSKIVDAQGNNVPFYRTPEGRIVFSEDEIAQADTKASVSSTTLSTPTLEISRGTDNVSGKFSAGISVGMKAGVSVMDGKLNWINFNFNPVLNLSAEFMIKAEGDIDKNVHLLTMYFVPGIPICPGVFLTPELSVGAGVAVGGSIQFKTVVNYNMDLGRFGFSYLNGQGFAFRHLESEPAPNNMQPELSSELSGSLWASASLTVTPSISLCGLLSAGLQTEIKLKFGLEGNTSNPYGTKLYLQPILGFAPTTSSLGGLYTKTWDDLIPEIEFDPIWERYLWPQFASTESLGAVHMCGPTHHLTRWKYHDDDGYHLIHPYPIGYIPEYAAYIYTVNMFTHIDKCKYHLEMAKDHPTLDPWDIELVLYTGTTSGGDWSHIAYAGCEYLRMGDWVWNTPVSMASTHLLKSIPAGSYDEVNEYGEIPLSLGYDGKTYGIGINAKNKRTGKWLWEHSREGNGFRVLWGHLPLGDIYTTDFITKEEYEEDCAYVPVRTSPDYGPNGYEDWVWDSK